MDLIWQGNRLVIPGGGLHIGWNSTPTYPLLDRVGNTYTTVIIGSQEWMVENLRTTKYADNSFMPNITSNSVPLAVTGWTNTNWDTFTSTGLNITSAIEPSGTFSQGIANTEFIPMQVGDKFYISYNLKTNSGARPAIKLILEGYGETHNQSMVEGQYISTLTISDAGNYCVRLKSDETSGTNCSVNMCIITGTTFNLGWKEAVIGGYCNYDNSTVTGATYGYLYNWYTVNNSRGLAYFTRNGIQESGWRIPTNTDCNTLSTYLGGDTVTGGKLKEVGTTHWTSPNNGATNEYGFTGIPSGYRNQSDGSFGGVGTLFYFWTTSTVLANTGVSRSMSNTVANFSTYNNSQGAGFAVRCVRDVV